MRHSSSLSRRPRGRSFSAVPTNTVTHQSDPGLLSRTTSFTCEHCSIGFATEADLSQHECPQDLQRQCRYCGRGFNTTGNLRRHERVHTGEKPFRCRFCEKSFTRKEGLRLHENLHTGRNPFSCTFCGMSFPRNKSRKNHEKICSFVPNPIVDT